MADIPTMWNEGAIRQMLSECEPVGECLEWLGRKKLGLKLTKKNGYGSVQINGQRMLASRAMAIFMGNVVAGMDVCHTCDNRKCVNPKHLFVGTRKDNVRDMILKIRGRRQTVTPQRATLIRSLAATYLHREIAAAFGISRPLVTKIVQRRGVYAFI